jgi:SpoVK/Ycf46/Vps4 family AAA+-type ATPase
MQLPPNSMLVPEVTLDDMVTALRGQKPTVSKNDLRGYEEFTKNYGDEGN